MGFGLLLCAYFLFTFMSVGIGDYAFATYLIGALVAVRAIDSLKDYNPRFSYLYPAAGVYLLLALFRGALVLDDIFLWGLPLHGTIVTTVYSAVRFACELAFSGLALWASIELACEVGLPRHASKGKRNLALTVLWSVGQAVLLAFPAVAALSNQASVKILLLLQLVVYFLNALFFYSCFSAICPKGEENGKPRPPSRFKFIRQIDERLDRNSQLARAEYERRLKEAPGTLPAKNNNRHHKKKK